ncbi:LamG domain-containing protein, partial [Oerskovia sp. NPDC057915]|uniref:LamG domain-containing protein n=1 Tax=Oerskovia sp. NPDC057915 TaxID=3346280 RepID=UPI0036D8ED93
DMTKPPAPTVTAVTGQPAVYLENQIAGGIGQSGKFTLDPSGAADVVAYKYSFNSDSLGTTVAVSSGHTHTILHTPTGVGSQRLLVQSVDRAGNTSDVRTYRFSVNFVGASSTWSLDEGAGTTAADLVGTKPLSISPSTEWVNGVTAEFGNNTADRALRFTDGLDSAQTTGPVLDTSGSFSVTSLVKLEDASTVRVAVSQDGQRFGAFKLGHLPKEYCGGPNSCWGFWMSSDDSSGVPVFATSTLPVKTNSWVYLTGVRDAGQGTISLYACEVGTPSQVGNGEPVLTTTNYTPTVAWSAGGPLQLGRAMVDGRHSEGWVGVIDDVRAYKSVVTEASVRRDCQNAAG